MAGFMFINSVPKRYNNYFVKIFDTMYLVISKMTHQLIICVLFLIINKTISMIDRNAVQPTKQDIIFNCMTKFITTKTVERYAMMMSNNWQNTSLKLPYNSGYILLNVNNSIHKLKKMERVNFYLLIFDNIDEFSDWLVEVKQLEMWNPDGKFVVFVHNCVKLEDVFELAWKFYLLKFYYLQERANGLDVFSYFPYKSYQCKDYNSSYQFSCNDLTDTIADNLFQNTIPEDLQNCEVKFIAYQVPPYVLNPQKYRGDPEKAGLEVIVFNTLADKMNFTEVYLKVNFSTSGGKKKHFDFMFGELYNQRADVVFGLMAADKNASFQNLHPSILEQTTWWFPTAHVQPRWLNLIKIYKSVVWLYILLSMVGNGIVWWLFGRKLERYGQFDRYRNCVLFSWYILLQGGIHVLPNSNTVRILVMSWILYAILMCVTYQSQLISILFKPIYEPQISNAEELLKSNLKFGFYPPTDIFFRDPDDPIQRAVLKDYIQCPITEECVNRTAFQRDFAVMKSKRQVLFLSKIYYTNPDGSQMLYPCKDGYPMRPMYFVLRGYPLFDQFNHNIMFLHASGLIHKWDKAVISVNYIPSTRTNLVPLTINHLLFGFLCLFIGLCISCCVFVCEVILYNKINKH